MPHEIRVPRLGWSMEEGTFVRWLKQPGESVDCGEPLFELEGDKALQEIEAVESGILHIVADGAQPGSTVEVGALLGYLLRPGESAPSPGAARPAEPARPEPATDPVRPNALPGGRGSGEPPVPPPVVASPRARRVATHLGIDWTALRGTGRDGRVREADVLAAAEAFIDSPPTTRRSVLAPRRRAIAERLRLSRDRTIPVTLTTTADATRLRAVRADFRSLHAATAPSYTDFLACAVAGALRRHPELAARWEPDHKSLVHPAGDSLGIGIAVHTHDGLLVPVLRDVDWTSVLDVARASQALIERARAGKLTAGELHGAHFSISNLGEFGIETFTPIINYPEIAILGVGAIRREPVVLAGNRIVAGDRLALSLTFDHAAVDGAPAAAFLHDVAAAIQDQEPRIP